MTEPRILTMPQAIAQLKPIGRDTVYRLAKEGRLRTITIRGRRYVPADEIPAFIERESQEAGRD